MKILVCGGRDFTDYARLKAVLDTYAVDCIISGMASGADSLAVKYARENNIRLLAFPALWKIHGKAAGPIRNQQMLDEGKPDLVIAMPGGRGTSDMITRTQLAKIQLRLA